MPAMHVCIQPIRCEQRDFPISFLMLGKSNEKDIQTPSDKVVLNTRLNYGQS